MVIHAIPMGIATSYLVCDQGMVLVDVGDQGRGASLRRRLGELGISPSQIRLIYLPHGHWDHIGALGELKQFLSCPVAIHYAEKEWVEKGLKPMPPGVTLWGKILKPMIETFMIPRLTFGGVPVDIALGDEPYSLKEFGVDGTIYHTPGHSAGSSSLILGDGAAFVGDLAMNARYMRLTPGMPIFAESPALVPASWRLIREHGARMIYPAHGKPFKADYLK